MAVFPFADDVVLIVGSQTQVQELLKELSVTSGRASPKMKWLKKADENELQKVTPILKYLQNDFVVQNKEKSGSPILSCAETKLLWSPNYTSLHMYRNRKIGYAKSDRNVKTCRILVGDERPVTKPEVKTEQLEWVTNFRPAQLQIEKSAKQYDSTLNSLCPSGITGQFPYPADCKRFVNCWKGRGMVQVCGPGTLFNPATGECDFPDKVECIEGDGYATQPQPLISRFPNSRPAIRQNPRISRKDKENYRTESVPIRPYPGRPPYFGPSHLTRPTPRPTVPSSAKLQEKVECPRGGAGLYPHPTDCTQFLNCWGGRMFIQKCGPGTYFDPDMSVCDHIRPGTCANADYEQIADAHVPPEEYKETIPKSTENYPVEDLYNSATNLFDVRSGVEEENDEQKKEAEESKKEQTSQKKEQGELEPKERDPSWGKILNWGGNTKSNTDGSTLFYDSHGNPVNSNNFWNQVRKPYYPQNQQQPGHVRPENKPEDSNVYYIRPHNHVMNQYPPHLQNNWAVKNPIYHNPQSYPQIVGTQTERPPPSNPYYPSAPAETIVPGHYILVDDRKPIETRTVYDQHQFKEEPPTYLVPPREDYNNFRPTETTATDRHQTLVEPSRELLPPHVDYPIRSNPVNLDYNNWKPYYDPISVQNATLTQNPNFNINNRKENHNKRVEISKKETQDPNWNRYSKGQVPPATEATRDIHPVTRDINRGSSNPAVTVNEKNWTSYYGNRNPYGFSPLVTRTTTTETPSTTTAGRVYVVYPVKTFGEQVQDPENIPYESSHKLKGTPPKKATEEDLKKWMKPEFSNSEEDLNVRDVEIYSPTIEELLPNAGKNIRLKSLSSHLDGYIEMKNPQGEWGLVCDKHHSWMINEASVVCRELGYGKGAHISWQGYPLDSSTESIPVTVSEVTCNGNEDSLKDCRIMYTDECDITKDAVGIGCFDNVTTQCHPEEVEYNNSCYRLVKRDDLDDAGLTLEEAASYCNRIGGRITDVTSEEENDFISQWLMDKHPEVRTVLTGGIGSSVMGRSIWMWFGSQIPMIYQKWWKGWADENKIKHGTVHDPSCVVLRKSYPCFVQNEEEPQIEVELGNLEPEFCSANYFYWDVEKCKKLKELKMPYLCKKPLEDIGCVVGKGEDYSGKASVTSSGLPCLPWEHPEVKEKLSHQVTLQEWSTKLAGHNFCRNLGRQELHPWCFVEGKENSEYCSIPQCWDSVPGYSKSTTSKSSCDETEFECKPGECIKRAFFCNGNRDCSNGRDEAMCSIFLQEFTKVKDKKMKGYGKEEWPNVNENTCAKLCLENKKFKCRSFSFDNGQNTCLLSDTNSGLSGEVIKADGWTYYELSLLSLNCSMNKSLIECKNGKCVKMSNICDGKDNCGDGTDERDCEKLGYEIRLAGSNQTNKGRVEVKVLGKWGAVCDDRFNLQAGEVVCRELGFQHGLAEILLNSEYPANDPVFLVDDLECFGNETSIRECSFPGWGVHDCRPEETVGVICRVPETECPDDKWHCTKSKECVPINFLCDNVTDCDDKSDENEIMCNEPIKFRLAGGPNATAGRLEIRYLGTWGTICDDNFNNAAASVICRILGYYGPSYALKNAHFGPGKGPIWLDGVQCFGNETNVHECDHSEWGMHNCKHNEDISISCSKPDSKQKSSAWKPIATSSDSALEQTSAATLKQVLLKECSEDGTTELEKISFGTHPLARVVGSGVVPTGIPWQASIRVRSPGGKSSHWCGAIVISQYHILTAGHCLRDYSKPAYFVRVGDFDTELPDPEEQELNIDHMYIHPEFNQKLHLNNDIALIKIKGEIRLGEQVRPACLAPSKHIYNPGTNCSISGWGSVSSHSTGYARTLRRAYIPILEPSLCRAPFVYGDNLSEGMFCAGKLDGGIDSCQGDSGGPITCEFNGREYLFGVTSWGHGCGRANKPGVYTNVAVYSEWLQEKIDMSVA